MDAAEVVDLPLAIAEIVKMKIQKVMRIVDMKIVVVEVDIIVEIVIIQINQKMVNGTARNVTVRISHDEQNASVVKSQNLMMELEIMKMEVPIVEIMIIQIN